MCEVSLTIELGDHGMDLDTMPWSQLEFLETEGKSLDELINNATVFATDQDGGEAGQYSIGDTSYYEDLEDIVRAAFLEATTKPEQWNK